MVGAQFDPIQGFALMFDSHAALLEEASQQRLVKVAMQPAASRIQFQPGARQRGLSRGLTLTLARLRRRMSLAQLRRSAIVSPRSWI